MNFPHLELTHYKSNILIEKTNPKMSISGQVGNFRLEKEKRQFEIEKTDAKLEINSYPAKKQLNLKRPMDVKVDISQKAQQAYYESLAERSQNADLLLNIQDENVNALKEIAIKRSSKGKDVSLNIQYFPQEPIEINVTPGDININYAPEKIKTHVDKTLNIEFQRGEVNTKIDQYPKIEVDVVGDNIDYII
jgi:hypothetical protein